MSADTDLWAGAVGHGAVAGVVHARCEVAEEGARAGCRDPGVLVHFEFLEMLEVDDDRAVCAADAWAREYPSVIICIWELGM